MIPVVLIQIIVDGSNLGVNYPKTMNAHSHIATIDILIQEVLAKCLRNTKRIFFLTESLFVLLLLLLLLF